MMRENSAQRSELEKLVSWCQKIGSLFATEAGGVVLDMFERDNHRQFVTSFPVPPGQSDAELGTFAQSVFQRAFEEASGSGNGLHRFIATAMEGDRTVESKRFSIQINSAPEDPRADTDTRSLLNQTHAHLEAVMRIHNESQQGMHFIMASMFDRQSAQLERYEAASIERQRAETERIGEMYEFMRAKVNLDEEIEEKKMWREIKESVARPVINEMAPLLPLVAGKAVAKMFGDEKKEETAALDPTIPVRVDPPCSPPALPAPPAFRTRTRFSRHRVRK